MSTADELDDEVNLGFGIESSADEDDETGAAEETVIPPVNTFREEGIMQGSKEGACFFRRERYLFS